MRFRVVFIVFLVSLVAACSQPAPTPDSPPAPDLAAEERAIRDADARWLMAAQARDAAAEAAGLASDSVLFREHIDPLVGPAAFQAWVTKVYADNPKQSGTWSTDSIHIAESGDPQFKQANTMLLASDRQGTAKTGGAS
jgi:ketosteroid isomerase-like protein